MKLQAVQKSKVQNFVFVEPGMVTVSPTGQENCVHEVVHIGGNDSGSGR